MTAPGPDAPPATATLALVGQPNVGKSTLFNLLTGARQKTTNAPRTTVSLETGRWRGTQGRWHVVDLPGTYSLIAQSPDELVATQTLVGGTPEGRPTLALVVVDATALASSIYLLGQVAMLGLPVVVALTKGDIASRRGTPVDPAALQRALGVPVVAVNPRAGRGERELRDAVGGALLSTARVTGLEPLPATQPGDSQLDASAAADQLTSQADALFEWSARITAQAEPAIGAPTRSDKIDRWLLKPWLGVPVFLAVLWAVFQLTTVVAAPLQDWFEGLITGPVSTFFTWLLGLAGWQDGWFHSLLVDGVLTGVGTVLSFLPLMVIIFAAIFLLEDSGYMARVAFVADRAMRAVGLDGRAVLPLVVGFGCNVPALAATKTLPNARQRTLTAILVPFTSCTARLVVFVMMATIFFPAHAGTVVFLMYVASVLVIVGVGWVLRHTAFRAVGREPLVLNLPPYQVPRIMPALRSIVARCKGFVTEAGKVIMLLCIGVWALMSIPVHSGYSLGDTDIPAQDTVFGAVSDAVAPVFAPAGFADWHISASLITGFVAKEAVVGTLATTYGLDEPEDAAAMGDPAARTLASRIHDTLQQTSGGHGGAAAIAFMVFSLVYTPCLVTVAEQRRIIGGKLTALCVVGSLVLAWVLAVAVFQIGALI